MKKIEFAIFYNFSAAERALTAVQIAQNVLGLKTNKKIKTTKSVFVKTTNNFFFTAKT